MPKELKLTVIGLGARTFGMTQGIAPEAFLEVISQSAGTSWMLENRAPHLIAGDCTPLSALDIRPKDLASCSTSPAPGNSAPLAAAAPRQFVAAAGSGLSGEEEYAIAKVYAHTAGISLPKAEH